MKPRKVTAYWTQEDGLPDNEVIDWEIPYTVQCDVGDGTYSRRGECTYDAEMTGEALGVIKRRPEGSKKFVQVDTIKRSLDAFCDHVVKVCDDNEQHAQEVYDALAEQAIELACEE